MAVEKCYDGRIRTGCGSNHPQVRADMGYSHELSTAVGNMGTVGMCEASGVVVKRGASHRPWLGFDSAGEIGDLIEQTSTLCH